MPSFKEAFPSKWIKAEDCNPPLILEIKSVGYEDVGTGTDVKRKLVVRFVDREQGLGAEHHERQPARGDSRHRRLRRVGRRPRSVSSPPRCNSKNKLVDAIRVQPIASPQSPATGHTAGEALYCGAGGRGGT